MTKAEDTAESISQGRWLEPGKCRFFRRGADLCLTIADEVTVLRAKVLRLFPLVRPYEYLSVRNGGDKEVGMLRHIDALDPESRAAVAAELSRRYFLPVIQRIRHCQERCEAVEWEVETDRGPTRFVTRLSRQEAMQPSPGRYIIVDADGNRYDIPNVAELDARSQALLWRYI